MRTSWLCLCALLLASGCGRRSLISSEADFDPIDDALGDAGTDAGQRACGFGPPCDPQNLGGMTCEKLGLPRGALSCEATTCELDISACRSGAPPTGTGVPGPAPGGNAPTFFGGGGDAGFFGGNFFGGGMGGNPPDEDGGVSPDEDAGSSGGPGPGPGGGPGGSFFGGNFFGGGTGGSGGGFFGGGFFGGGTGGSGGGFFGGGFFGGGTGGTGG